MKSPLHVLHLENNPHDAVARKPLTPSALARKLREVLDQPRARKPETVH